MFHILFSSCNVNRILYPPVISIFLLFSSPYNSAQPVVVIGIVTNEKGDPMEAASVTIKGTRMGVATDAAGKFRLGNVVLPATVNCSGAGYTAVEKKISVSDLKHGTIELHLVLAGSGVAELSCVVVTAPGRRSSAASPGYATASVSSRELSGTSSSLRGKIAGLKISTATEKNTAVKSIAKAKVSEEKEHIVVASNTNRRTGLLTAGEVNDFKKWRMWQDYNKEEFKSQSEEWELFATARYCVQLQNQNGKAIIGQKVYLLNGDSGDTLWRAVTDNTGKAELWNGFNKNMPDENAVIAVDNGKKRTNAVAFARGVNRITINTQCNVSPEVEIAFVVDATGSMQDEINYLKEELQDVLEKIMYKNPNLHLKTGAVFYRDRGDAYLTNIQPLKQGITATVDFIKNQDAGGGGDYPEAVDEGLYAATEQLKWNDNARTRIIFLLMDAPPHAEAKSRMAQLIIRASAKGIRIVPVACSGTDKSTEFIMRSMALASNGTYLFLTDDSGIGESHIKPTTDEIKVELLNDLLQRTIEQMCFANTCENIAAFAEPIASFTNTEKIKIFPNPSTGPVTIQTDKKLKEVFIADFTGKLLLRKSIRGKGSYGLDLSNFPSGTYFINYVTEENTIGTEKFILMR